MTLKLIYDEDIRFPELTVKKFCKKIDLLVLYIKIIVFNLLKLASTYFFFFFYFKIFTFFFFYCLNTNKYQFFVVDIVLHQYKFVHAQIFMMDKKIGYLDDIFFS